MLIKWLAILGMCCISCGISCHFKIVLGCFWDHFHSNSDPHCFWTRVKWAKILSFCKNALDLRVYHTNKNPIEICKIQSTFQITTHYSPSLQPIMNKLPNVSIKILKFSSILYNFFQFSQISIFATSSKPGNSFSWYYLLLNGFEICRC